MLAASLLAGCFSFYSIKKDGIKERFPVLIKIYGRNEFDNKLLQNKSMSILGTLAKEKGFSKSKPGIATEFESSSQWFSNKENTTKILIAGNSHSRDLFNALYQNRQSFNNVEFARFGISVFISDAEVNEFVTTPNFKSSDIVIISFRYAMLTVSKLPKLIQDIQQHGKRVYLASNTVEFKSVNKQPIFDWYLPGHVDSYSADVLNSIFFHNQSQNKDKINQKLEEISNKYSIKFLNKYEIICNSEMKQCEGVTPDGYKAFYDYGHWTLEGAKYFGRRMVDTNWLGLN